MKVSPIRVRPLYMTRYSFRDHPNAAGLISNRSDEGDSFDETTHVDEDKEKENRRASTTEKSLYSHVIA